MTQITKKLKQAQAGYAMFNLSVILFFLMMGITSLVSWILEKDVLLLNIEFTFTSLDMWLLIGGPAILFGVALIFGFINYSFIAKAKKNMHLSNFNKLKSNINWLTFFIWIIAILILGIVAIVTLILFLDTGNAKIDWSSLGLLGEADTNLYLQLYSFGAWAFGVLVTLLALIALILNHKVKTALARGVGIINSSNKPVDFRRRETRIIKNRMSSIEGQLSTVDRGTQNLSNFFDNFKGYDMGSDRKLLKEIVRLKTNLYQNLDDLKVDVVKLERNFPNIRNHKAFQKELNTLKNRITNRERDIDDFTNINILWDTKEYELAKKNNLNSEENGRNFKNSTQKIILKNREAKKEQEAQSNALTTKKKDIATSSESTTDSSKTEIRTYRVSKNLESKNKVVTASKPKVEPKKKKPTPKKVVPAKEEETIKLVEKPRISKTKTIKVKTSVKKTPQALITQQSLIKSMHTKLNSNLTLGDIYKFDEKLIRKFLQEFASILTEQIVQLKDISLYKFLGLKHYISKQTTRTNPQNPGEIIDVPKKNKVKIIFSQGFKDGISKEIERPVIKWEKKMTVNLSYDEAWEKVSNNINNLLTLSKQDLIRFANYANVKILADSKKETIVDRLKYVDIKYFKAMERRGK